MSKEKGSTRPCAPFPRTESQSEGLTSNSPVLPRRDRGADRLDDLRDDVLVAQVVGPLGHLFEQLFHWQLRAIAPVPPQDQVNTDHVIGVITSTNLVAVGSRDHINSCLEPA